MAAETSQTLDRGLRVLALLAETPQGMTVTALAARLEINRTIVYRLLATLEQHGYARRDPDGRARLGLGVTELTAAVHPLVRDAATPILRGLAEQVGATAHLTIADGGEALALVVVEPSWTDFHVAYRMGSRHPLDRGAAGRAILAARPGGPPQDGPYVVTESELQSGAQGVAAPVPGTRPLEASVGVVAIGDLDVARVGPIVVRAATAVGSALR